MNQPKAKALIGLIGVVLLAAVALLVLKPGDLSEDETSTAGRATTTTLRPPSTAPATTAVAPPATAPSTTLPLATTTQPVVTATTARPTTTAPGGAAAATTTVPGPAAGGATTTTARPGAGVTSTTVTPGPLGRPGASVVDTTTPATGSPSWLVPALVLLAAALLVRRPLASRRR